MNFSKFASKATNTQSKPEVSTQDFELFLETCQTMGGFYMERVLSSIYWNGVIGVYNSIHNCYGDHAPSYMAIMEKQKADSAEVVYWLHSAGYRPEEDGSINDILSFIEEDFSIDAERVLVTSQHVRELKKHNPSINARMTKAGAKEAFSALPEDIRKQYQDIVDNNVKSQRADQTSAQKEVVALFANDKNVDVHDINPEKVFSIVKKLDEKVADWIKKEEDKKFISATKGDQYMVDLTASTLALLDNIQSMSSRLVSEAEETEQSNTSEELINKYVDDEHTINDSPDKAGVNAYNGGYNFT